MTNSNGNALLKINSHRAKRYTEEEAREVLARLGFQTPTITGRSGSRDGKRETVRYSADRFSTRPDGAPRYDRAVLTVTFSI